MSFPLVNNRSAITQSNELTSVDANGVKNSRINGIINEIQKCWYDELKWRHDVVGLRINFKSQSENLAGRIRKLIEDESYIKQLEILSNFEEETTLFLPLLPIDSFEFLLPYADQSTKDRTLKNGINKANAKVAYKALDNGADPNSQFVLHWLCEYPSEYTSNVLSKLILKGVSVNTVNKEGFTPLTVALTKKPHSWESEESYNEEQEWRLRMVRVLERAGAKRQSCLTTHLKPTLSQIVRACTPTVVIVGSIFVVSQIYKSYFPYEQQGI